MRIPLKRWLTALLCLVLLAGMLPMTAGVAAVMDEGVQPNSLTADAQTANTAKPPVAQIQATDSVYTARLESYEQFLAYYYLTFSALDYHVKNDLPYHTYVNHSDEDLRKSVAAWRASTMDGSDVIEYSEKEEDFYELLIFDILYQHIAEDAVLNNAMAGADAYQVTILSDIADAGLDWNQMTAVTSENADEILNNLIKFDNVKFIADEVEILKKGMEYVETLEDLLTKLYMLSQISECSDEVRTILEDLYKNATDECMKEACRQVALVSTGLMSEGEILSVFSGEIAIQETKEFALDKLWDGILSSNPLGQGFLIGQGVGKLACNIMCSTDDIVENWYSMAQVYKFENILLQQLNTYRSKYESSPTYNNAVLFCKAADMYLNTRSVGMDYAIKYTSAVKGGGILGWIYKNFTHKDDYDQLMSQLNSIKSSIDLAIDLANNNTYNFYMDELEAEGVIDTSDCQQTPEDTTIEEVEEETGKLPEIDFLLTDQTTDGDTSYSEDKKTYANYTHSGGTLDLNGQTLTVYGDFFLTGGTVNVHGGTLEVRGDLYVTGGTLYLNGGTVNVGGSATFAKINTDGSYGATALATYLKMDNDEDVFTIGGDLVTCFYSGSRFEGSAGTMNIGGSWSNYKGNANDVECSGTFTVVFTGSSDLLVYGSEALYVPNMVIENASGRNITMRGTVKAGTLSGGAMTVTASKTPILSFKTTTADLTINGDTQLAVATQAGGTITVNGSATLNGVTLNGNTMHITGDALIQGDLTVGNAAVEKYGTVTVGGNLQVTSGTVHLNYGAVSAGGSAIFGKVNTDGSYGATAMATYLKMDNDEDVFTIGGDLVTCFYSGSRFEGSAGTMNIGGSWSNYKGNANDVECSGTFTVVFTGSSDLLVYGSEALYVPNMVIENASGRNITMRGTVKAGTLSGGAMTITASKTPILSFKTTTADLTINGDTQLAVATKAGGTITVNGSATLNGVTLNGNTMHITGDALIQGDLTVGNAAVEKYGTVTVGGNLQVTSGTVHLNYGAVSAGGSAIFGKINTDGSYGATAMATYLKMDNDADVFTIGGDLVTCFYSGSRFEGSAGTMNIGGSWSNYKGNANDVECSGTFTVVFTGSGDLLVYGSEALYVPNMVIENASGRNITMRGTVKAGTLSGGAMTVTASKTPILSFKTTTADLTINGDTQLAVATKAGGNITVNGNVQCSGFAVGANTLTVNGDLDLTSGSTLTLGPSGALSVTGDVRMSAGTLSLAGTTTICGNLYQSGGDVKPNQGLVTILGDYRIQTADESSGELVWGTSSGRLHMVNDTDRVVVGGSFYTASSKSHSGYLTAGTLYICGNFQQISGNASNFKASGTHRVILCGTQLQSAAFASASSMFNILRLTQDLSRYTFNPDPCWNTLEENAEIPDEVKCLNGHTWDEGTVILQPGCEEAGQLCYTCTVCGASYQESIPALGHAYEAVVTAPTCTSQGCTTHTCSHCGDSYTDSYTDPVAHSYDAGQVTTQPTCTEAGIMTYTCTVCGTSYQESVPALGHAYEAVVTAPTCTSQGCTTHTCSHCGDSYTDSYTDPVAHSYDAGQVTTQPACTEAGVMTYTCTVCHGTHMEAIDALGHAYDAVVTPADCLNQGHTTHTCTRCGDSYTDSYTDALGHAWNSGTVTQEPTADTDGIRTYTCTRCGETRQETIPALGSDDHVHDYKSQVTAPTCDQQGYTTYICVCGDSYTADYVDPLGHAWGSGSVLSYPSCEEDGSATYTCQTCGAVKTDVLPAYGHDYDYEEIDPTCTTHGYILYTCQECDDSYRTELVNPIGHFYQDGVCRRCNAPEEEELASGICGDNLTWRLTAEPDEWAATLTISGTGNMWDFDESNDDDPAPWAALDLDVEITRIIIESGCTSIGDYAFDDMSVYNFELETVVIADTVTRIGMYAFQGHDYLETICLPAGLKTIEDGAFRDTGLLDVEIPDSVTSIRAMAFEDCVNLTRAVLPEGLTLIEERLFFNSGLESVNIPATVTKIEDSAFNSTNLVRIEIPEATTRIGENAFCFTSLDGTVRIGKNVISIGSGAFAKCGDLDRIEVSGENLYYASDDQGALYNKAMYTLVQVPGEGPRNFVVPSTVTRIGAYAFSGCRIRNVVLPESVISIGTSAFRGCYALSEIVIPQSVTSISDYTFMGCYGLKSVVLPNGLTAIGENAFSGCTALAAVTIPENTAQIGDYAFRSCTLLKEIVFSGDAPAFGSNAFYDVTATAMYPAGNATWTSGVMADYGGTITWTAYSMPEEIASGYSGSTTWSLLDNGVLTFSGEGAMRNYTYKSEMPWYAYRGQISSVVIGEGITSIGDYAFYGMPLESISIADSVTAIGSYAFKGCENLDRVVLPSGLTKLGESAFYACTSLSAIDIPASLWTVQPYTFKNCTNLASVTFHEGNLQKISDGAFYATAITELVLPDCLGILDVYSFKNCTQLASVKLSAGMKQIREACLYGTAISTIEIPEGVTSIKPYAFKNCVRLTGISLPSTLTSVGEASFYACTSLASIDLPDAVTEIGNYAFRKCSALKTVRFGAGLVTIGESSFYGCTGLTGLNIPRGVTTIKAYAFKGCTGVTSVTLPSTLQTLGDSAFHTCTGLTELIIPGRVTAVGEYCFSGSSNLRVLEFLGNAPAIGSGAFNKVTATVYYPGDNATWTADIMQNYGGTITWKAS